MHSKAVVRKLFESEVRGDALGQRYLPFERAPQESWARLRTLELKLLRRSTR
jgi:hypothetical protein